MRHKSKQPNIMKALPAVNYPSLINIKQQLLQPEITKKIVPILFLLLTQAGSVMAQTDGELKFSRVVLVENVTQTVPLGKVWKVESALYSGGQPLCLAAGSWPACNGSTGNNARGIEGLMAFLVNGLRVDIPLGYTFNGYPAGVVSHTFPFWLPAGSTLQAFTNVRYLSVLEFSVVP